MTRENEQSYVSWTWIVSVLVGILMIGLGALINDTRNSICELQRGKLDKTEYYKAVDEIRAIVNKIDNKMDKLSDSLANHEKSSRR